MKHDSIYIAETSDIGLLQYTHEDDFDMHRCWQDTDTQKGYNGAYCHSLEEYSQSINIEQFKFWATVTDKTNNCKVGSLRLGLDEEHPDLAIWIYPEYRSKGYGLKSFRLSLEYIFKTFDLDEIWAGCFTDNKYSMAILTKLGFEHCPEYDETEPHFITGEDTTMLEFRLRREKFKRSTL